MKLKHVPMLFLLSFLDGPGSRASFWILPRVGGASMHGVRKQLKFFEMSGKYWVAAKEIK